MQLLLVLLELSAKVLTTITKALLVQELRDKPCITQDQRYQAHTKAQEITWVGMLLQLVRLVQSERVFITTTKEIVPPTQVWLAHRARTILDQSVLQSTE